MLLLLLKKKSSGSGPFALPHQLGGLRPLKVDPTDDLATARPPLIVVSIRLVAAAAFRLLLGLRYCATLLFVGLHSSLS